MMNKKNNIMDDGLTPKFKVYELIGTIMHYDASVSKYHDNK